MCCPVPCGKGLAYCLVGSLQSLCLFNTLCALLAGCCGLERDSLYLSLVSLQLSVLCFLQGLLVKFARRESLRLRLGSRLGHLRLRRC